MEAYEIKDHLVINKKNDIDIITVFDLRDIFHKSSRNKFEHFVGTTEYINHLNNLKKYKNKTKGKADKAKEKHENTNEKFIIESKDEFKTRINSYVKHRVFDKKLMQDYIFPEIEINLIDSKEHIIKILEEHAYEVDNSKSDRIPINNFFENFKAIISLSLNGSILVDIKLRATGACLEDITLFVNLFHMKSDLTHFMTYLVLKKFVIEFQSFLTIARKNKKPEFKLNEQIFNIKNPKQAKFEIYPFIKNNISDIDAYNKFKLSKDYYEELKKIAHLHYFILSTHGFHEGVTKKFGVNNNREFQLNGKKVSIKCLKQLNLTKCQKIGEQATFVQKRYENYQKQIMCFLRGTLVGRKCSDVKLAEYPITNKNVNFIKGYDLSGQEDGLCLLTSRKALIIFNKKDTDYWKGIIQAIKLMLCTKVEYTAIEYNLFKTSAGISNEILKKDLKSFKGRTQEIADITSTLQRMRFLLVPPIVSSSVSIIKKLDALIYVFGLRKIDDHIKSDIIEINSSLSETQKIELIKHIKTSETQIKVLTYIVVALTAILIVKEIIWEIVKLFFPL
ncbi:MAG: hypothetical protein A4E25_01340 [Methanobacterium sp. PtaB.Bin024]|nr:MAG: hypothetical protein A4E25_01340 [Methanobacterium sp. PtaB.Bin024]